MEDYVFCKIVKKEKKEEIIYEDDKVIVFPDHAPRTPTHLLITPKVHYDDFDEMLEKEPELLLHIALVIKKILTNLKKENKWYTWGFHCGGKQSVNHIHAQLISDIGEDQYVL